MLSPDRLRLNAMALRDLLAEVMRGHQRVDETPSPAQEYRRAIRSMWKNTHLGGPAAT